MNKKQAFALGLAACWLASSALAKTPPKTPSKAKPQSVSKKIDQIGENQLKLLKIQELELQHLREILQQMKARQPEPGYTYPYSYP